MTKPFFAFVVVVAIAPFAAAAPQSPAPSPLASVPNIPTFEVVSVKANRSNSDPQSMRLLPGGRVTVTNTPLRPIILTAYGLLPQQLVGAPAWIDLERFDIVAQARENLLPSPPGGPPGAAQLALQRLLAERFNLAVHTDKRELPIYALTVARGDGRLGPRMAPAKVDCAPLMAAYGRGEAPMPPRSECGISGAPGRVTARGANLTMLARTVLAGAADRMIEDRTGLTGGFDFDLEFTPDPGTAAPTPADHPSLFTALEEQLGLKLQPRRESVDVVVVDRVERPTEN